MLLWDVMQHLNLEKIRSTLQGSTAKFSKIWQSITEYVGMSENVLSSIPLELSKQCGHTQRHLLSGAGAGVSTFSKVWVQIYVIDPPFF